MDWSERDGVVREREGEGWRADADGREREPRRVGEYRERK